MESKNIEQQPEAQAVGLTDDEILDEFARKGLSIYDDSGATRPVGLACLDAARALLSRAAPSGEPVAYVECRECGRCGHTGINDAHSQDECCSNCDWTGPAPKEDVCPGCAQTGTMRAACPKCGSVYRLLCETTLAAPQPSAQQAEPGSPMKAAADALRRKAELEQAHQDGYRDGFKAAQAMLDKAEQPAKKAPTVCNCSGCNALRAKPAEEARGVDGGLMEAIRRYAFLFALHTQNNTDASRTEADAALARVRALLAAPAAAIPRDEAIRRAWEGGQALQRAIDAAPAAGTWQGSDVGQDYSGPDCPYDTCYPDACACKPAEEAPHVSVPRQVIEAITRYGDARADAVSPTEPSEALGEVVRLIRALLAAPAAGTGEDKAVYCECFQSKPKDGYCQDCGLTRMEWLQAATGAQGLTWISVNDRLPPIGTGERVLIYTEGADFAGEQFFDIKADDLYPTPDGEQDARTEVAAAATHWMPLPYPGITPNQKDA